MEGKFWCGGSWTALAELLGFILVNRGNVKMECHSIETMIVHE